MTVSAAPLNKQELHVPLSGDEKTELTELNSYFMDSKYIKMLILHVNLYLHLELQQLIN